MEMVFAGPDIGADEAQPPLSHDAAPHLPIPVAQEVKVGSAFTPTVSVLNIGLSFETMVTVLCTITQGENQIFEDTRQVENLASMAGVDIIFRSWTQKQREIMKLRSIPCFQGMKMQRTMPVTRNLLARDLRAEFSSNSF